MFLSFVTRNVGALDSSSYPSQSSPFNQTNWLKIYKWLIFTYRLLMIGHIDAGMDYASYIIFSDSFFIIFSYFCSFMVVWSFGVGVLYWVFWVGVFSWGGLGAVVWGLLGLFSWGSLYKHKRITLEKNGTLCQGWAIWCLGQKKVATKNMVFGVN